DARTATDWFEILSDIGPLLRAADGVHETLLTAQQLLAESDHDELQPACDLSHEIVRAAELLHQQAQHSIDYLVAQQNEQLARTSQAQASAAHRLNVMAALFFPLATISSVFGMNISHGFENSPLVFWAILILGGLLGLIIGMTVFKVRSWDPQTW
ncbi:MAG: CorA family divalent cation transporter, partial [Planctomycetota bacterium]